MKSKWILRASLLLTGVLASVLVWTLFTAGATTAGASNAPGNEPAPAAPGLQATQPASRTITVVGEGDVRIRPDIATTNVGVEVVADSVRAASDQQADIMNAVMEALRAQGVADQDMQTSGYSVWVERPYGPEGPQPDAQPLYHVTNQVAVTIRDLDNIGPVLDAAIEAGANNIFGISFQVSDPSTLMAEARQEAVEDAQTKAAELAGLANVQVGSVISISEIIAGGPIPLFNAPAAEGLGGGAGPISPGELEMKVQLQVTYAIQ
jgi:uncharacterized protein YggE